MKKNLYLLLTFAALFNSILAQPAIEMVRPMLEERGPVFDRQSELWSGMWITVPGMNQHDYSVSYYRKDITLEKVPQAFVVHVTGDNRYKLYVNGALVSVGPARGDLDHWKVSKVNLTPYLHVGKNVVAAMVCNYGKETPCAVFSQATGLLIDGEGEASILNTDESWYCMEDKGYRPYPVVLPTFYVAGPGEIVDMNLSVGNWLQPDYDMSGWNHALPYDMATPHDTDFGTGNYTRLLVENNLPEMERTVERLQKVRRIEGDTKGIVLPEGWPLTCSEVTIPAHHDVTILLDKKHLTNAYFNLKWSKGKGARITSTYAESLYADTLKLIKANRDEVEGLKLIGRQDQLLCNGDDNQFYQTLEWRTFRYIALRIQTDDEALTIDDLYGIFTGYPFTLKARLETNDQELQKILEIGWRTQRLCAYETYMDCPYYEQLQYLGDTRIQALITLFNTGDDTMVRNFLMQADQSRNAEGCAQGRYPTVVSQYITPYALSYVYAVHDYTRYCDNAEFVATLLPGIEAIMSYFTRYQQADGRLQRLPGWNFSDWVDNNEGWASGVAKRGADHCSALMDLQFLMGLEKAAELETYLNHPDRANGYKQQAAKLRQGIQQAYWDDERGLYADASDHKYFSQHTGSLALLAGMIEGDAALKMGRKLLTDNSLAPCSVYYKYYLHAALIKAGLGDEYLSWLDIWRENISLGLTTWAETSDVTGSRSDCHAWGASPNIEIYRTVLGIDSDAPGFRRARIEPHLSGLKADKKGNLHIGGVVPSPSGEISVDYKIDKKGMLHVSIILPEGMVGSFIWKGKKTDLAEGRNDFTID